MNYKKLIVLLLVITFPLLGFSQSNPKNGKIILSNGEVLEGEKVIARGKVEKVETDGKDIVQN